MSSPHNQKRLTEEIDYISNLPDAILCHILSSFSTKFAVRTSILSKRWRYLWISVPFLDFTEMPMYNNCDIPIPMDYKSLSSVQKLYFRSFVDKVLLHNNVSYVQRFSLDLYDIEPFYVTNWLLVAARRAIHEVNINLHWTSHLHIYLPPWIIWVQKLVILKLKGHLFINASMCGHFPNLETIHLEGLKFSDDEFLKRLSFSCPILKELHIVNCDGITTTIHISSLTLKSLKIMDYENVLVGACFVIRTPNLRYLCLCGQLSLFDFRGSSLLVEADLTFSEDDDVFRAQKLLRRVSGVSTLRLGSTTFWDVSKLPLFPNLTLFEQCFVNVVICRFLKCSPKLQSLILVNVSISYSIPPYPIFLAPFIVGKTNYGSYYQFDYGSPFDPKIAPECLPCLENILFQEFEGDKEEIRMIAYFLKAAPNLKEVKMEFPYYPSGILRIDKLATCRELLHLPRSSPVCHVDLRDGVSPHSWDHID